MNCYVLEAFWFRLPPLVLDLRLYSIKWLKDVINENLLGSYLRLHACGLASRGDPADQLLIVLFRPGVDLKSCLLLEVSLGFRTRIGLYLLRARLESVWLVYVGACW